MTLYAELLDSSIVGTIVRVASIEGRQVASQTLKEGQLGIIKSIQGKVAFITLNRENKPELDVASGSALGVKIEFPITVTGSLSITLED